MINQEISHNEAVRFKNEQIRKRKILDYVFTTFLLLLLVTYIGQEIWLYLAITKPELCTTDNYDMI